jgi:hypothetical protein
VLPIQFSQDTFVITNTGNAAITITDISLNEVPGTNVYAVAGNWDGLDEVEVSAHTCDLSKYEPVAEHPLESVDVNKDGIVIPADDTAGVYFTAFGMGASAIDHSVTVELRCADFDAMKTANVIVGEANLA